MTRVTSAADLFGQARLRGLRARLDAMPILDIWTRFERRYQSATELRMPPVETAGHQSARLPLAAPQSSVTHLELSLPALPGERFVGFGERFNALDQRGSRLETWAEEGSFGVGEKLSPLLDAVAVQANPLPKGPTTAYKPLPWFISSRGYGLCVNTSFPVFYDVAASDPNRLVIEIAAPEADVLVWYDADPAALVERFTGRFGRPRGLPDWAYAPWVDAIEGSDEVRRVARLVRAEKIPCAAIWTEDWPGGTWEPWLAPGTEHYSIFPTRRDVDRTRYPDLENLAGQLHDAGFKFLGYHYPYVDENDPAFAKAEAAGYFLRRADGSLAAVSMVGNRCGQIDLTNPAARAWYAGELRRSVDLGFDGWMADFGEYTPIDAVTADGETGLSHHNRFPLLWAQLNREVWERARPDGDFVFFSRSGWLGSQAYSSVVWTGDSDTNFERWDGLPSNLPAMLTAGLSGYPIWTVDVGGYMSLFTEDRDAETLARWVELAAPLPVLRTHHGTQPHASLQFHRDPDALSHFRTWARMHAAFFPHLRGLVDEACATGLPVCRPLLLHHPEDVRSWQVVDQFLCGPYLLVAPVVERGARHRAVYLPPGYDWIDVWSGQRHRGGADITVPAPVGVLPMFLRSDGLLATFDTYADTYVRRRQVADPDVRTLDDAEISIALFVGPDVAGEHRLYDGTVIRPAAGGGDQVMSAVAAHRHEMVPSSLTAAWRPPVSVVGSAGVLRLPAGRNLAVRSPTERRWTCYCTP